MHKLLLYSSLYANRGRDVELRVCIYRDECTCAYERLLSKKSQPKT